MPAAKRPSRPSPDAFDIYAKRLIKSAMELRGISFKGLAAALEDGGFGPHSENALALRINRASFSMGFALGVLRVMEVPSLDISHMKIPKLARKR